MLRAIFSFEPWSSILQIENIGFFKKNVVIIGINTVWLGIPEIVFLIDMESSTVVTRGGYLDQEGYLKDRLVQFTKILSLFFFKKIFNFIKDHVGFLGWLQQFIYIL